MAEKLLFSLNSNHTCTASVRFYGKTKCQIFFLNVNNLILTNIKNGYKNKAISILLNSIKENNHEFSNSLFSVCSNRKMALYYIKERLLQSKINCN